MNKNGFTLIELLAVVVVLAIVLAITISPVNSILKKSKKTTYDFQINTILKSTYDYSLKNPDILPNYNETSYISLATLKQSGFIDLLIKNPETNEYFLDNLLIKITNVGSNYKNTYDNSKLEGNYLFIVLDNYQDYSDYIDISLSGTDTEVNGNYVVNIDLNEEFEIDNYTVSITHDNIDLDNVNLVLLKYSNNTTFSEVDTTKQGLYKINYVANDNLGHSSLKTLSIIVSDQTPPELDVPTSTKISTDVSTFDLMTGVSCTDNSEICSITYTGTVSFGTTGKYVIEYTAVDSNGNSTTKRRVITVGD